MLFFLLKNGINILKKNKNNIQKPLFYQNFLIYEKSKYVFFDYNIFSIFLKQSIKFLSYAQKKKLQVLLLTSEYLNCNLSKKLSNTFNWYFLYIKESERMPYPLLTNYKDFFRFEKKRNKTKQYIKLSPLNNKNNYKKQPYPEVLFFLGFFQDSFLIPQSIIKNIPTITFINANNDLDGVSFPLISNNFSQNNFISILYIFEKTLSKNLYLNLKKKFVL